MEAIKKKKPLLTLFKNILYGVRMSRLTHGRSE